MRLLTCALVAASIAAVFSGCQSVPTDTAFGPQITAIAPVSGPPTTTVELTGTGFGPMVGAVNFTDKNKSAVSAPIMAWTDTLVRAQVPVMPSGVQTAVVDVQSSAFAPSAFKVEFRVTAP